MFLDLPGAETEARELPVLRQRAACNAEGFRPCKRCRPLGQAEPFVAELVAALQADPARRWGEADLVARGLDPSTVRRAFGRHFGTTFLEMARAARLRAGFGTLKEGGRVIEAEPGRYFAGEEARFSTPLALHGSEFTRAVWQALRRIPAGETRSHSDIAAALGRPEAVRAVGANIEDQAIGRGGIRAVADQVARLRAVHQGVGPDFFVNARTDLFLQAPAADHAGLVPVALGTAACAEAGASGFFVPGLADTGSG